MAKTARVLKQPGNGKREALKRTVIEVAAKLFAERGFAGTSPQDIADALGISRPTLYYYFSSKDEILAALVEEVTVFSQQQSTQVAKADRNPGESLRLMTRNHAKLLLDHAVQFRAVDRSEADLPEETRQVNDAAKRIVLDNFTGIIARGAEIGHFRPVDPRVAAFAILGMCSWTTWWFRPTGPRTTDEIAEMIADLALHSVRREDARRPKGAGLDDALQVLREDIDHLQLLMKR
jgi:AcrR family transcriptional regulator